MAEPTDRQVLFVGSFQPAKDGTMGGQLFACTSLVNSPLSNHVTWIRLDSTQLSLPLPGIPVRACHAAKRVITAIYYLLFRRVKRLLVFTPFLPASFIEKGLICVLGRMLGAHVVLSLRSEIFSPSRFSGICRWYVRLVIHSCHHVICQSPGAANAIQDLYGCSKAGILVVPNWIDASKYPNRDASLASRDSHPFVILYMGWLNRSKGVFELIRAVQELNARKMHCRLIVCGGGDERINLERLVGDLELEHCVEFRGWVGEHEKLLALKEADVLALPSDTEGLPNSVMEAMASGLPIVASAVGGIPTLIEDGKNGHLIEPKCVTSLVNALAKSWNSRESCVQMGQRNRCKIRENYDVSTVWRRLAEALDI